MAVGNGKPMKKDQRLEQGTVASADKHDPRLLRAESILLNAERERVAALKEVLRGLSFEYLSISSLLQEQRFHLERINNSPWWRLGMLLTDFLAKTGMPKNMLGRDKTNIEFSVPFLDEINKILDDLDRSDPLLDPKNISYPQAQERPLVSILVLSFGHSSVTQRCLSSIFINPPSHPYEIFLSDDFSHEPELKNLINIKGLNFIEPEANLGWTRHVNWATQRCRGKYIILLNNDVEVRQNALDSLIETIISSDKIGVVGSKLLYPNGRLQEAGGIIWNDGSAWNYGKNSDPKRPEFNFLREVDYVSGASMIFSKSIWNSLEGFDESFSPAYYEDVDFCFRVRQLGKKVVYQPRSEVMHFESVSYGSGKDNLKQNLLQKNKQVFLQKWGSLIKESHYNNHDGTLKASDRFTAKKKTIAIVDHYALEPDRDAGSKAVFDLIQALKYLDYSIKFWPDNLLYNKKYTSVLQKAGIEVAYAPWSESFESWIEDRNYIDSFVLCRPEIADKYIPLIKKAFPDKKIIYFGLDIHHLRLLREADVKNDINMREEAAKLLKLERAIWNESDVSIYLSQEEARSVNELAPKATVAAINPYYFSDLSSLRKPPECQEIIFVAGFNHPPNVDAAIWIARDIFPLIQKEVSNCKLLLVGSNPKAEILALSSDVIEVTGYVSSENLVQLYNRTRVAIVPLRFGAGVKLKVVEALHVGIPLVTTSIGAQGLPRLAEFAFVYDEPEIIANMVVSLLRDDELWTCQSKKQLQFASENFSFNAYIKSVVRALGLVI